MEAHFKTERFAPLIIGGIPDTAHKIVKDDIEIPGMLSFMTYEDFNASVKGLDQIPKKDQPPIAITHLAFDTMVSLGMLMMALAFTYFIALLWRRKMV